MKEKFAELYNLVTGLILMVIYALCLLRDKDGLEERGSGE